MSKKPTKPARNWALVIMGSILILMGLVLCFIAVKHAGALGWWAVGVGCGGLATIGTSVMSIVKNDPSWILLGLILPG